MFSPAAGFPAAGYKSGLHELIAGCVENNSIENHNFYQGAKPRAFFIENKRILLNNCKNKLLNSEKYIVFIIGLFVMIPASTPLPPRQIKILAPMILLHILYFKYTGAIFLNNFTTVFISVLSRYRFMFIFISQRTMSDNHVRAVMNTKIVHFTQVASCRKTGNIDADTASFGSGICTIIWLPSCLYSLIKGRTRSPPLNNFIVLELMYRHVLSIIMIHHISLQFEHDRFDTKTK